MTDIPNNTSTSAVLTGTGVFTSSLELSGDSDWWRVDTVAGRTYDFTLSGDGSATSLDDAYIVLRDAFGTQIDYKTVYNGQATTLAFTATSAGPYYIDIADASSDSAAEGSYRIAARMSDLLPRNGTTTATLVNGTVAGNLEASGDGDWYRVNLRAGQSVDFLLSGDGSGTSLDDAYLTLLDASGTQIDYVTVYNGGAARLTYTALTTGTFFIAVTDASSDNSPEGSFRLTSRLADAVVNNSSTTLSVRDGGMVGSVINASNDEDWVRFDAVAGRTYTVRVTGDGSALALDGQYVGVLDNNGTRLDYDYSYGAGFATVTFTATRTGRYYFEAAGGNSGDWGNYRLSVISDAPVLTGTTATERLTAGTNNNRVVGLAGNDTLDGNAGNDTLVGGAGNDLLFGNTGIDTADFAGIAPIRASLATTAPQVTGHGTDTLRGIENLAGGNAGDVLSGNSAANRLEGRGGNDTLSGAAGLDRLIGGAGNDRLNGGSGADTVVYQGSAAVAVNLRTGLATGGEGRDTLISVEHVFSGAGNDTLTGSSGANTLNAGAGNDRLYGGTGNDRLYGGAGADRFVFGRAEGSDVIGDFRDGIDRIELTTAANSFRELTISSGWDGAVVSWDGGQVTLVNISASQLTASDFIFS